MVSLRKLYSVTSDLHFEGQTFKMLTLWLQSFQLPSKWHGGIILQPGTYFRFHCLPFGTDVFGTHVSRAENWSSAPNPQYRVSVYTFFKAENQEIQFPLLCTKPSKDKQVFVLQRSVVLGPMYRLNVPSEHYQFSRFIGLTCHNSEIEWAYLLVLRAN